MKCSIFKTKKNFFLSYRITLFVALGVFLLHLGVFAIAENASSSANLFQDTDGDGLSDAEEKSYGTDIHKADTDGDGYTDGAEVLGGYDPLKKAPGDKLLSDTPAKNDVKKGQGGDEVNLTDSLSTQMAGLLQDTALNSGQGPSMDDLNSILSQTLGQKDAQVPTLPEIDESTIKIKKQDYSKDEKDAKIQEDTREYVTSLAYILISSSPISIKSENDLASVITSLSGQAQTAILGQKNGFFDDIEKRSKGVLDQVQLLEVPENMLSLHKKVLQLAQYGLSLKKDLDTSSTDPVGYVYTLSKVQVFINASVSLSSEFEVAVQKSGITTLPSLF